MLMPTLAELLKQSAALHDHICPRQVLGVRMGQLAGELLQLELPQSKKRLLTIVETDGCFADGVSVATNSWVGRRTLRVEDYGKTAATFVDTGDAVTHAGRGDAWRIVPHPDARDLAHQYAPEASSRWESMLLGYQRMPDAELLLAHRVELLQPVEEIVSHAGLRAICARCGEEIINQRELHIGGEVLCRSCARGGYYHCL
jgi:formylmethanofuran dehydrogenase subunit E